MAGSEPRSRAMELVSLCCSLNSPVVSIPELPVGPASAAIAIHTDVVSGSHITVAVQCRRTADVVLFRSRGDSEDVDGIAGHAALLWAESMGFLFDEDLCTEPENESGVRNELATEIWRRFVQDSSPPPAEPEPRKDPDEPGAATTLSKFRFQRDAGSRAEPQNAGLDEHRGAVESLDGSTRRPSLSAAAVA